MDQREPRLVAGGELRVHAVHPAELAGPDDLAGHHVRLPASELGDRLRLLELDPAALELAPGLRLELGEHAVALRLRFGLRGDLDDEAGHADHRAVVTVQRAVVRLEVSDAARLGRQHAG